MVAPNDPTAYTNDASKPTNGQILLTDLNTICDAVNTNTSAVSALTGGAATLPGPLTVTNGILTPTIGETVLNAGVAVDSCTIRDGTIIPSVAADPSTLSNGQLWYNSNASVHAFKGRINGNTLSIIGKDGLYIPSLAGDPSSPSNGQIWYNSTSGTVKGQINGSVKTISTGALTEFVSADQTITTGAVGSAAHGLGAQPNFIALYLKCTTAEYGYAIGDLVPVFSGCGSTTGANGVTAWMDDTANIEWQYGNVATVFYMHRRSATAGNNINFTNANWRFVIKAWRIVTA